MSNCRTVRLACARHGHLIGSDGACMWCGALWVDEVDAIDREMRASSGRDDTQRPALEAAAAENVRLRLEVQRLTRLTEALRANADAREQVIRELAQQRPSRS